MLKINRSCPLGHQCESVKDGEIDRCEWYREVKGMNPQTGDMLDEYRCAIAWMPTLMLEVSRTNRGQTSAIESFRNEVVQGNAAFAAALLGTMARPALAADEGVNNLEHQTGAID
jgi:hypothetical protein